MSRIDWHVNVKLIVWLSQKGNTGSCLFTKVKPCWMGLISGWVTIWIISLCCTPWEVRLA